MSFSEDHLSEPTYPVHCLHITWMSPRKAIRPFLFIGVKVFLKSDYNFFCLQFHGSFFLTINPKTWRINLTELFPGRIRIFVSTSGISQDFIRLRHCKHIAVFLRFQKNWTPFCSHNLAFSFRYCLELRNRIRAKSHSYF